MKNMICSGWDCYNVCDCATVLSIGSVSNYDAFNRSACLGLHDEILTSVFHYSSCSGSYHQSGATADERIDCNHSVNDDAIKRKYIITIIISLLILLFIVKASDADYGCWRFNGDFFLFGVLFMVCNGSILRGHMLRSGPVLYTRGLAVACFLWLRISIFFVLLSASYNERT